jgi:crotonobetainyl-CoA:carnitine CoA-transferase CaiB-like acyl-CoA transferase
MTVAGDPNAPEAPAPRLNALQPTYNLYQAGDGQWFVLGALPQTNLPSRLINGLGVDRILQQAQVAHAEDIFQPENEENLRQALETIFLEKGRAEWMKFLDQLGIPCGLVSDRDEWINHPHLAAMGLRFEITEPGRRHVVMPGILIDMAKTPGRIVAPAPRLGEDDGLLRSGTPTPQPPNGDASQKPTDGGVKSGPQGGPLAGLRVLNAGAFIAGPAVGYLLAELGADVIKVEPPQGDPFRVAWICIYRVADGWVRVRILNLTGSHEERIRDLICRTLSIDPQTAREDPGNWPVDLESALSRMTVDEALRIFDSEGLAAVSVQSEGALRRDDRLLSGGLLETHLRSDGRAYVTAGRLASFSRTPRQGTLVAPGVGQHTRSILQSVGVGSAELDELLARNIAVEGPAMDPVFL